MRNKLKREQFDKETDDKGKQDKKVSFFYQVLKGLPQREPFASKWNEGIIKRKKEVLMPCKRWQHTGYVFEIMGQTQGEEKKTSLQNTREAI